MPRAVLPDPDPEGPGSAAAGRSSSGELAGLAMEDGSESTIFHEKLPIRT